MPKTAFEELYEILKSTGMDDVDIIALLSRFLKEVKYTLKH